VCGNRWAWPLDFGYRLKDGERLFGEHKTWRGLLAAIAVCSITSLLVGVGYLVGAAAGLLAIAGDATSSAIKRRLGRPPGAEVPGLDQVPEALLPLLVLRQPLGLSFASVIAVTLIFAVLDVATTPLRHPRRNGYSHEQER
jgi:CDP-2,3-bis-(O-geranylgeranyl)-sn-glycerol synthase